MRFYKQQHKYFCGVDLHARKMWLGHLLQSYQYINTRPAYRDHGQTSVETPFYGTYGLYAKYTQGCNDD